MTSDVKYSLLENVYEDETFLATNQLNLCDGSHRKEWAGVDSAGDDEVDSTKEFKLQRTIGIFSGINIVVGSMIGSGIFIVPSGVLRYCHGNVLLCLCIWVAAGVVSILMALCYCEMATKISESGGTAAYLKNIYGDSLCFIFLWLTLFAVQPQGMAVQVIALGDYVSIAITSITHHCFSNNAQFLSKLIGLTCLVPILLCNVTRVKWALKLQIICTVGKVTALFVLCIAGFIMCLLDSSMLKKNFKSYVVPIASSTNHSSNMLDTQSNKLGTAVVADISLAIFQALWAYDGFDNITFITEEVKKPKKSIPIIIIVSVLFVMVLYMFVNISYVAVLTADEILTSKAVAVSFAAKVHPLLMYLVTGGVCLSLIGTINVGFLTAGRIPFVAGRMGFMPQILSMIHCNFYSPFPALLFAAIMGGVMLIPSSIDALLHSVVFVAWAFRVLCAFGLLLPRRMPCGNMQSYEVYKLTAVLASALGAYVAFVPVLFDPQILYGLSIILSVVFFVIYKLMKSGYIQMNAGIITANLQKCFLIAAADDAKRKD